MKKIFLALAALISLIGNAQEEKSLLWKISGNGLSQPSYLFGTIHITCDATLDENVLKALDETSQLYLEIDMDDPDLQVKTMQGMMMKDGKKISAMVSAEQYKALNILFLENIGMSVNMLDNFKPSFVEMMLLPSMLDCPTQSIENELLKLTKEQNEEVYGLETIESQMEIFDAIPYEEQAENLAELAEEGIAKNKEMYKQMIAIYDSKDLNAIADFMKEEENAMYEEHSDILLDNRNKSWIEKIEKAAKNNPTFFGVGAAHLPGKNGVINLLRKQGYKVEAVK